jgi:hypothetical protein
MNFAVMRIYALVISLVLFVFALLQFDASQLTHHYETGFLRDKWHEESCTPMYDDKGSYQGETCSDVWTILLSDVVCDNRQVDRLERKVTGAVFKSLKTDSIVAHQYDSGRLGIWHNEKYCEQK